MPTSSAPSEERAGSIELDREEETDKHREVEGGVLPGAKPPVLKPLIQREKLLKMPAKLRKWTEVKI